MRTFGIVTAVLGAILGFLIGPFGWFLLIVGLLLMIAASAGKEKSPKPASGQSTGGYAGLAKNKKPGRRGPDSLGK